MKVEKIQKIVTDNRYVAEDGTCFSSRFECQEHEARLQRAKYTAIVEGLPRFNDIPPDADQEACYVWYYVQNHEQLEAVKRFEFSLIESAAYDFEPDKYPCWVRATVYDSAGDFGESTSGTLESYEDVCKKYAVYLEQLASQVSQSAFDFGRS